MSGDVAADPIFDAICRRDWKAAADEAARRALEGVTVTPEQEEAVRTDTLRQLEAAYPAAKRDRVRSELSTLGLGKRR